MELNPAGGRTQRRIHLLSMLSGRALVFLVALVCSILVSGTALAQTTPTITRPVTDLVSALSPEGIAATEAALVSHQQRNGTQIAVLIISTTGGEPIEDYAHRAAVQWGGGTKEHDKGALLVLAISDRKSRIEVGYGLEGPLSDGVAKQILDSLRPALRNSDYDGALAGGLNQMIVRTGGPLNAISLSSGRSLPGKGSSRPTGAQADGGFGEGTVVWLVILLMFGVLILLVWVSKRNASRAISHDGTYDGQVASFFTDTSLWSSHGSSSSSGSSSSFWSSSSDSSSSFWSSSDSSSSSSDYSGSDYSGGGGDFGGGGASSDW